MQIFGHWVNPNDIILLALFYSLLWFLAGRATKFFNGKPPVFLYLLFAVVAFNPGPCCKFLLSLVFN